MDEHTSHELAYKKGYDKGYADGKRDAAPKRGFWKGYVHSALVGWTHGEPVWADRNVYRCDNCDFGTIAKHNFCPRCGADMREPTKGE